jgi:hypothetical protein
MKTKTKESKPKVKSLFDHVNEIRVGKNPNYFSTLSEADQKTWSNYMVCRVLSMQPDLVDVINDLQYYQDKLTPEQFYKVCIAATPKGKGYFPYIKNSSEKHNKSLLKLLSVHFQDSERNIVEYLQMISRDEVRGIVRKYGYTEDQIEEMLENA